MYYATHFSICKDVRYEQWQLLVYLAGGIGTYISRGYIPKRKITLTLKNIFILLDFTLLILFFPPLSKKTLMDKAKTI